MKNLHFVNDSNIATYTSSNNNSVLQYSRRHFECACKWNREVSKLNHGTKSIFVLEPALKR